MALATPQQATELDAQHDLQMSHNPTALRSRELIGWLEGGDGAIGMRVLMDKMLDDFATAGPGLAGYTTAELLRRTSILDKLSYLESLINTYTNINPLQQKKMIDDLHARVLKIETQVLDTKDFSENFILRHSALNVVELRGMTPGKRQTLNQLATRVQDICRANNQGLLVDGVDFTQESDAQKIQKIREVLDILRTKGINVGAERLVANDQTSRPVLEVFTELDTMMEPMKTLDRSYKNMTAAYNLFVETQKHDYQTFWTGQRLTALIPGDRAKLNKVLVAMGKKESDFVLENLTLASQEGGVNMADLQSRLAVLKTSDREKFQQEIKKNHLSEDEFGKLFLVHFGYETLKKAKESFQLQKTATFGHKESVYDRQVSMWKERMRTRILGFTRPIFEPNGDILPGNENDIELLNGYFANFPTLFLDNANNTDMQARLREVLRYRLPIYARNNPQVLNDAVNLVINEVRVQNDLAYNPINNFNQEEGRGQRFLKILSRTEDYRQSIKESIAPTANTLLRMGEEAAIGTAKVLSWAGKGVTNILHGAANWANKTVETKAEGGFFKKNLTRLCKTPLYLLYPATKPGAAIAGLANKAITKTEEATKSGYQGLLNFIKKTAKDDQIDHLFQGMTYALDGVSSLAGRATSATSNFGYEFFNTQQKRAYLESIAGSARSEEQLREWLEVGDIAHILDTRKYSTYIFEDDGRVNEVYDPIPTKNVMTVLKSGLSRLRIFMNNLSVFGQKSLTGVGEKINRDYPGINAEEKSARGIGVRLVANEMISLHGEINNRLENFINEVNQGNVAQAENILTNLSTYIENQCVAIQKTLVKKQQTNINKLKGEFLKTQEDINQKERELSAFNDDRDTARRTKPLVPATVTAANQNIANTKKDLAQLKLKLNSQQNSLIQASQTLSDAQELIAHLRTIQSGFGRLESIVHNNAHGEIEQIFKHLEALFV